MGAAQLRLAMALALGAWLGRRTLSLLNSRHRKRPINTTTPQRSILLPLPPLVPPWRCGTAPASANGGTPAAASLSVHLMPLGASDLASVIQQYTEHIYEEGVIGLDAEWQPEEAGGPSHPVALLQLSTRQHAFLFQLLHMEQVRGLGLCLT